MRTDHMAAQLARVVVVLGMAGAVVACSPGAAAQPVPATALPISTAAFPVTINNCDRTTTFTAAPKRTVAFEYNMIETLMRLGLSDRIVAYWTSGATLSEEMQAQLASAHAIPADWPGPSREAVLEQNPDFVFAGWGYGFSDESGLTPAALGELQVQSYAVNESCPTKKAKTTIDDTYDDIANLGRIFGVSERSDQIIAAMQSDVADVGGKLAGVAKPRVFIYDDIGESSPFTAGGAGLLNNQIALAGGENIFSDIDKSWSTVSWESVIERSPEVIVVMDTDWESAATRIERLKSLPQIAAIPAIQHGRFVIIHYRQATPGVQNADGVKLLARGFHPDLFR